MPLDRTALKSRAREVIATSNPRVISVGLVYLLIGVVLSTLGARVMSVNISESEAMNYFNYAMNGNYDYALRYAETDDDAASHCICDQRTFDVHLCRHRRGFYDLPAQHSA